MEQSIKVPAEFFRKSLREYRNWRWAMIREFIQNSSDAGATNIRFSLREREVGGRMFIVLQCVDNGSGMSRETLTDVFLCLGGSKKPDGSIGGFGYAKTILAFAHESYFIHSLNNRVHGSGGTYTVETAPKNFDGTVFEVAIDKIGYGLDDWKLLIKTYVAYTNLPKVSIYLDDTLLAQDVKGYEYEYKTEIGTCEYSPIEGDSCRIVISMRGLPMFIDHHYSNGNQSVTATLNLAGTSFDNLTANRDGFTAEINSKFSRFMQQLLTEYKTSKFGHSVEFEANPTDHWSPTSYATFVETEPGRLAKLPGDGQVLPDEQQMMAALSKVNFDKYPRNFQLEVAGFSARRNAKTDAYVSAAELVADMKTKRNVELAYFWRMAVSLVLSTPWARNNGITAYTGPYQEAKMDEVERVDYLQFFQGSARIDTGFAYAPGAEALCKQNGVRAKIMLNPAVFMKEEWFFMDMIDTALHECAHLWETNHGERFTQIEGQLRKSMRRMVTEREVEKAMQVAPK